MVPQAPRSKSTRPQNSQLPFTKGIEPWELGATGFQTQQGEKKNIASICKIWLSENKKRDNKKVLKASDSLCKNRRKEEKEEKGFSHTASCA